MRHKDTDPPVEQLHLPDVMAALSDPTRLGLVRALADGEERNFGAFCAPVAKSTLSHHLRTLRAAGIVHSRTEGTRCYLRLRRTDLDTRFPHLLDAVLTAATQDAIGTHVTLQPHND
ncbi:MULTISPECIES: ArsR/SmtB family transcription factor [unclassified Saccharothrix]|uniref:ArsR/SmtB family transcription factor n=1 Tax=unclassified Saccharothrix TaxID=2593673 RepID=UPI00307EC2C1